MANPMKAMLAQKKAMTPKNGFNLVGLDDYEKAGEQLFLISSHKTEREASKAQKDHHKKNPDTQTYIYGGKGAVESIEAQMNALLKELGEDS